ncbi:hypothetical protein PO909_009170 [Leuciscus waleckii]
MPVVCLQLAKVHYRHQLGWSVYYSSSQWKNHGCDAFGKIGPQKRNKPKILGTGACVQILILTVLFHQIRSVNRALSVKYRTCPLRPLHSESEIRIRIFRTLKNKFDLTLCQSRLHTASETFVRNKNIRKPPYKRTTTSRMASDNLIHLVSQHKALYDKQNADYKNTEYKDRLWQVIAEQLGKQDDDQMQTEKERDSVVMETEREGSTTSSGSCGAKSKKMQAESEDNLERYCQWREARDERREKEREAERQQRQAWQDLQNDEVSIFLSSLAPSMRRLTPEKLSYLKIKMQELVHNVSFGGVYYQQFSQDPNYRSL